MKKKRKKTIGPMHKIDNRLEALERRTWAICQSLDRIERHLGVSQVHYASIPQNVTLTGFWGR